MDALQQPLQRVAASAQWFLIADEIRLLHIVTTGSLRLPVLEQLALSEHSSLNRTPYAVLEAPVETDDDGWSLRAAELLDDWRQLRDLYAKGEPPILLPELPEEVGAPGLAGFGMRLRQMLDALPGQCTGLTLILSPVWVNDGGTWLSDLTAFLSQNGLRRARLIVVDLEDDVLAPLREQLGDAVEFVDARVDAAAAQQQMREMVAAMAAAPPGADGARMAGLAGPSVPPPRRWNAPPELIPEERSRVFFDADLPSALADQDSVQELKSKLFEAAEASQRGDYAAAVEAQRRTRDLALEMGLERESVVFQVILGSYYLQAGDSGGAQEMFARARDLALEHNFPDLGAQAQLALASALLVARRTQDAAVNYTWAGNLAHQCGEKVLAIEAYRIAGQVHAAEGRSEEAAAAWQTALTMADAARPAERKASTAAEAAESLAELCRSQGLEEQANALEAHVAVLRAEAEAPAEEDTR